MRICLLLVLCLGSSRVQLCLAKGDEREVILLDKKLDDERSIRVVRGPYLDMAPIKDLLPRNVRDSTTSVFVLRIEVVRRDAPPLAIWQHLMRETSLKVMGGICALDVITGEGEVVVVLGQYGGLHAWRVQLLGESPSVAVAHLGWPVSINYPIRTIDPSLVRATLVRNQDGSVTIDVVDDRFKPVVRTRYVQRPGRWEFGTPQVLP
jgi:hypothetical protein